MEPTINSRIITITIKVDFSIYETIATPGFAKAAEANPR